MLVVVDDLLGALVATRQLLLPEPFTLAAVDPEFRFRMVKPLFLGEVEREKLSRSRGKERRVGVLERVVEEAPDPAAAREAVRFPHDQLLRVPNEPEELLQLSLEVWREAMTGGVNMSRLAASVLATSRLLDGAPIRLSPANGVGVLAHASEMFDVDVAVLDTSVDPDRLLDGTIPTMSLEDAAQRYEALKEARRSD